MSYTIEDFERLDVPPDVKMLAFSLLRRGPGRYDIMPTARMLNTKHGKVAALGAKMRRVGLNASTDPAVIEITDDNPWLAAFRPSPPPVVAKVEPPKPVAPKQGGKK